MFRKNVFVSLLFLITSWAVAQSEYTIDVSTVFSPTLKDAQQKINEKANIVDTVKVSKPVDYNIVSPMYLTRFTPEPIKAPRVGKDQITRLYRNFIKLGAGNWGPYLDFEANSLRSTSWAYGGRLFHYSSWGKVKDYAPAGYSDTKVEGYMQKFFKNYTLNATAGYSYLLAHCYGMSDSLFKESYFDIKNIRRQYHHVNANVNFSNNNLNDNKLNQIYAVNYDFLIDNFENKEHQLGMAVALNHDVVKTKKSFILNVGGKIGFDYFHNQRYSRVRTLTHDFVPIDNLYINNAILNINPHIIFKFEEYFLKLGFDALLLFPYQQDAKFHFYPDVEFRLAIVPKVFSLYAGLDGGMKRNSYLSLMRENPYLSNYLDLGFTDEKAKIFAGIQLGISRSLSIGARGAFAFYDGLPFFINDKLDLIDYNGSVIFSFDNTFKVVEDRSNHLNVHFDLKYQYKNQLGLALNLDYNQYFIPSTAGLLEAWYKPKFIASFDIDYRLLEKFLFGIDFYIHTGAKYPEYIINSGIAPRDMKAVFDFNFQFEYFWSKRLSFFLDVNNFAYQRNYFYHDYPSHRLNVLIGAKYNFGGEAIGRK